MNKQPNCCKEKLDSDIIQIVVKLNDAPLETRKNLPASPFTLLMFNARSDVTQARELDMKFANAIMDA